MIPCAWDVTIPSEVCPDWDSYPTATQDSALWLASTYLWAATGRRYGACPVTVRPAQGRLGSPMIYQDFPVIAGQDPAVGGPFLFGGRWFNAGCASACCSGSGCAIVLRGPVASVDEVLLDEDEVPSSAYRVDVTQGVYLLVRTDGTCWPTCQNWQAEPGEVGAFEVTYRLGKALPEALAIATAILACEYAGSIAGGECRLPVQMTSLSRQGVEVQVTPPEPPTGRTGIVEVDRVVWALNPTGRQRPPVILSPDAPGWCDRITVVPVGGS